MAGEPVNGPGGKKENDEPIGGRGTFDVAREGGLEVTGGGGMLGRAEEVCRLVAVEPSRGPSASNLQQEGWLVLYQK